MMAALAAYPRMKDSGVPWLGSIPASWRIVRNGQLFAERKETGFADLPILEVSLRSGVRVRRFGGDARKQLMSDRGKYKRACAGDLAYNMMRMWQGAVGLAPVDGLVSPAYVVARPFGGVVARYFAYLFRTDSYMGEVDQYSRGIVKDRNRLYWDQFKQMPSVCPPTEEQASIIRFLGYADRQIGRYIRAKQKLIKLLEEQKQIIIHHAVTRGLDPSVRLKPSGVEWLGDVPEHWRVLRVKHVARMESGHTPSRANPQHWLAQNDIPWVSLGDTKQLDRVDYISDTALHINALGLEHSSAHILPAGVVVFTRDAAVGKAAITTRPMAVSQHLIAWVCGPRILNAYLLRVFYAMKSELSRFTFGATIATIGMDDVRKLVTPVPPLEEQRAIATHVVRACERLNCSLDYVLREVIVLREFRARLIADVVTGKLDVREAAAALPNEAAEPELLDDTAAVNPDGAVNDEDTGPSPEEDEA